MMKRRQFLSFMAAGASLSLFSTASAALDISRSDQRFVFVFLRGAMDGLATLASIGDPDLDKYRGRDSDYSKYTKLNSLFALHPALKTMKVLYKNNELAFAPAIAGPYRNRSHFDAQDILEMGGVIRGDTRTGWIARFLNIGQIDGIALSNSLPLAFHGNAGALAWAPSRLPSSEDDLKTRLLSLYESSDPILANALRQAEATNAIADTLDTNEATSRKKVGKRGDFAALAAAAGRFLSENSHSLNAGLKKVPKIAMLELGGFDTHSAQAARLNNRLTVLDTGIANLKKALGETWKKTTVLIVSEFGRTIAFNGSKGTDHGTGGLAIVAGGNLKGGKIMGEWPGLNKASLYEGRDLAPANNVYALIGTILRDRLGLDKHQIENEIFPSLAATNWSNRFIL